MGKKKIPSSNLKKTNDPWNPEPEAEESDNLTQEDFINKMVKKFDGKLLTEEVSKEIFGQEKGGEFWEKFQALKKSFAEKFPNDSFAPVIVGTDLTSTLIAAGYTSNGLAKRNGKLPYNETDNYEMIILSKAFIKTRGVDDTIAAIAHEAAHDGRNHVNQDMAARNAQKPRSLDQGRIMECEADLVGTQLLGQTKTLSSLLNGITKKTGNFEKTILDDPHPSGEDRTKSLTLAEVFKIDLKTMKFDETCKLSEIGSLTPLKGLSTPNKPIRDR